VQRLLDELRAPREGRLNGLSGSKVRNVLVALKALYRHLLENDELTLNPTQGLRLPPPAGTRERAVSATEAAELLAALPADQRAVWATALYGGLRLGELLGLRLEDVDLSGGTIRVWRSWDPKAGQVEPKSRKGTRTFRSPPPFATCSPSTRPPQSVTARTSSSDRRRRGRSRRATCAGRR
jgi:integrase